MRVIKRALQRERYQGIVSCILYLFFNFDALIGVGLKRLSSDEFKERIVDLLDNVTKETNISNDF